jgi:hypothetical protein
MNSNEAKDNDLLYKTIRSRGFMNKSTKEQLFKRAVMLDYETLCFKIEQMMA